MLKHFLNGAKSGHEKSKAPHFLDVVLAGKVVGGDDFWVFLLKLQVILQPPSNEQQ